MTKSMDDMTEAKLDAQHALFEAITKATADSAALSTSVRATALAQIALAFRYASGGTQPGSVVIEK